jgi:hypothetical protein
MFKGPNRVDILLPSSRDGNRYSFRKGVFPSYLEFRTMGKAHKSCYSECYTPSPEPFTFNFHLTTFPFLHINLPPLLS